MAKPKRKPKPKPRSWMAWAMIDKYNGELSYICEPGTTKETAQNSDRMEYERVIRVRIEEVRPCSRHCPRQSRIEVTR